MQCFTVCIEYSALNTVYSTSIAAVSTANSNESSNPCGPFRFCLSIFYLKLWIYSWYICVVGHRAYPAFKLEPLSSEWFWLNVVCSTGLDRLLGESRFWCRRISFTWFQWQRPFGDYYEHRSVQCEFRWATIENLNLFFNLLLHPNKHTEHAALNCVTERQSILK